MPAIPGPLKDAIRDVFREMHTAWGTVFPHAITQVGAGAPTHEADMGTLYWDKDARVLYSNNDSLTSWTLIGPA